MDGENQWAIVIYGEDMVGNTEGGAVDIKSIILEDFST